MATRNDNLRDTNKVNPDAPDANRDPITGAPGSHPVGTGIGAAAAGAAGAAIGSVAGPVGTAVGAVIGAVAGGLAGKGVGEAVNPTEEDRYWRDNYRTRPYAAGSNYDDYRPAYQMGWEAFDAYGGKPFGEIEPDLRRSWEGRNPKVGWDKAKNAVKDSFERVYQRRNDVPDDVENSPTDTGRPVNRRDVGERTAEDLGRPGVRRASTEVP